MIPRQGLHDWRPCACRAAAADQRRGTAPAVASPASATACGTSPRRARSSLLRVRKSSKRICIASRARSRGVGTTDPSTLALLDPAARRRRSREARAVCSNACRRWTPPAPSPRTGRALSGHRPAAAAGAHGGRRPRPAATPISVRASPRCWSASAVSAATMWICVRDWISSSGSVRPRPATPWRSAATLGRDGAESTRARCAPIPSTLGLLLAEAYPERASPRRARQARRIPSRYASGRGGYVEPGRQPWREKPGWRWANSERRGPRPGFCLAAPRRSAALADAFVDRIEIEERIETDRARQKCGRYA